MSWLVPAVLAALGLALSAFFSGTETGFYRATRLRLQLDALGGDAIARGLFWLTRHPSLFIATNLVGNNLANYLVSLAVVMVTQSVVVGHGHAAEIVATLVMAPVLFVYGELLPKSLFLQAPNRLLRRAGPLSLFFVVLFSPVSSVLWGMNRLFERLMAESPEQVRVNLARRELGSALEEGHAAGILHPVQRGLAQGIFAVAQRPVGQYATPLEKLPRAHSDMTKHEVLRLALRYRIAVVPVELQNSAGALIGYFRVIDLMLDGSDELGPPHALMEILDTTTQIAALMRMQTAQEPIAQVIDASGKGVGVVAADRLREPLLRSGKQP